MFLAGEKTVQERNLKVKIIIFLLVIGLSLGLIVSGWRAMIIDAQKLEAQMTACSSDYQEQI